MDVNTKKVLVGRVGAPHGVKGWLRIISYTQPIENLLDYQPWLLKQGDAWSKAALLQGQSHGGVLLAALKDCTTRDQASRMTHAEIYVERKQLPKLPKGEYYWVDLEDLEVKNLSGFIFGKITRLMSTGANDVMFIKGAQEYCLPYLPTVVKSVDLVKGEMQVDWPEEVE